jgi:antitoxin component of MazEF toxin-antitoxin module
MESRIARSGNSLVLTLNPNEVMRVLLRYVRSIDEPG